MSYAGNPPVQNPSEDRIPEATGAVASDSLAAESTRSGGAFSENANSEPLGVAGANSTFANTDTSGATVLHSAPSGAEREEQDYQGAGSDERGTAGGLQYPGPEGQASFPGTHSDQGYTGGPSSDVPAAYSSAPAGDSDFGASTLTSSTGKLLSDDEITSSVADTTTSSGDADTSGAGSDSSATTGARPYVDKAPNYAGIVSGTIEPEGYGKPKGEGLTEGDVPQTKTFTGDVGGPHDPARLAEQKFEEINADTSGGLGARDYSEATSNPYDSLSSERAP